MDALEWAALGAAGVACVIGLALGVVGLFAPSIAARIVRLQADPNFPDGVAEFRASFGGLFVAVHGGALLFLVLYLQSDDDPIVMLVALLMAALLWLGTALGRAWALVIDARARTFYQAAATVFEIVLAFALAAPLGLWLTLAAAP